MDAIDSSNSILPDVMKELSTYGHSEAMFKFFKLVKERKMPLDNIALTLFMDVVKWYDKDDSRGMRYSDSTLQFFWLGKKLFGGRFLRFMSGFKNETDFLYGSTVLSPQSSKINFACPSENIIRDVQPLGREIPIKHGPGLIECMIDLKSNKQAMDTSYVIMFDGKKIRKGGDVDLLGFENGETLSQRKEAHKADMLKITNAIAVFKCVQSSSDLLSETIVEKKQIVYEHLKSCLDTVSQNLKAMRNKKVAKDSFLTRLKDRQSKDNPSGTSYAYSIDLCRTNIYQIENCIAALLEVQWVICKAGACLNGVGHLFPRGKVVNIAEQENVKLLKSPEEMKANLGVETLHSGITKQRSTEWFKAREKVKVTGSTIYSAIGCDGLKRQQEHFDKVISGVESSDFTVEQQAAMKHGTDSEVHQIATLASVIVPFLFPDLVFHEEGFYEENGIIVSPDGSLRANDNIAFAFEGKAPVGNAFVTPVHYKVPNRYISQTIFEQDVLHAEGGTLYLSWNKESTTVFIVPTKDDLCMEIKEHVEKVYYQRIPKRPHRLSQDSKNLKEKLHKVTDECEFVGEFPSVHGTYNSDNVLSADSTLNVAACTYRETLKALLKGKQALTDSYELQRQHASQVVVYLLSDLDRLWKPEEPHAVPILYFYRGYSLSMEIIRKITDYCKDICHNKGIDVVATASDGEFIQLMNKDKNGNPLTLYELSKKLWSSVCKFQKSEIVMILKGLNKFFSYEKRSGVLILTNGKGVSGTLKTPSRGWVKPGKLVQKAGEDETDEKSEDFGIDEDFLQNTTEGTQIMPEVSPLLSADVDEPQITTETNDRRQANHNESVEIEKSNLTTLNEATDVPMDINSQYEVEDTEETASSNTAFIDISNDNIDETDPEKTVLYEYKSDEFESASAANIGNEHEYSPKYVLHTEQLKDIIHMLRSKNDKKWNLLTKVSLRELLSSADKMKRFVKAELVGITNYLNLRLKSDGKEIKTANTRKSELINNLSKLIGNGTELQHAVRKRKQVMLKSLQQLSAEALMKKSFPKQVLNVAYATYLWPETVSDWYEKSRVAAEIKVVGSDNDSFKPFYVPEFNKDRQEFEVFTYDRTHLATNLRKCVCLNKVEGVSIKAWQSIAKLKPDILNPSVIEVSDEGKILDQMKERLACTMFSEAVEVEMVSNNYLKEADFCRTIRNALFVADDKPGVRASERCHYRIELIKWLNRDVDFGQFPPYGARIKGLSHILYVGLRSSQEAKLYLYTISKKQTYCVRAPNTLCSESFFSSMQEMDPWGQGVLTTEGVEKHISDFTTVTALKMEENRQFHIVCHDHCN